MYGNALDVGSILTVTVRNGFVKIATMREVKKCLKTKLMNAPAAVPSCMVTTVKNAVGLM